MCKNRSYLSIILLVLIVILESTIFSFDGFAQEAYPPPVTGGQSITQNFYIYLPFITELPTAPSYYITQINSLYSLGYALGVHDRDAPGTQDNLVILDYGYPAKQGSTYGVILTFDETGTFHSASEVIN